MVTAVTLVVFAFLPANIYWKIKQNQFYLVTHNSLFWRANGQLFTRIV